MPAELVSARTGSHPDAPALFTALDGLWTYRHLEMATGDIARQLSRYPTGPVAIVMENRGSAVAAFIAADRQHRSVVLLPASIPNTEKTALTEAVGSAALVYGGKTEAKETKPYAIEGVPSVRFVAQLTSGSLGPSRLAVRSRQGIAEEIEAVTDRIGLGSQDRVVCASSIAHSYALIGGLLASLAAGAEVDLGAQGDVSGVMKRRPTILFGLPRTYEHLTHGNHGQELTELRLAFSAGSPLPSETFSLFQEQTGHAIRQDYGTTETGTICLEDGHDVSSLSVGKPLDHLDVRIETMPGGAAEGSQGEVQVRGAAVALGYCQAGSLSAVTDEAGWYHTRDVGSWLDDRISLHGRLRAPLTIQGMSVRPEVVEETITAAPGVTEVAVIGVGSDGSQALKAVVAGQGISALGIGAWCRTSLPAHQIPSIIQICEELPRSPAGKVLHRDLLQEKSP